MREQRWQLTEEFGAQASATRECENLFEKRMIPWAEGCDRRSVTLLENVRGYWERQARWWQYNPYDARAGDWHAEPAVPAESTRKLMSAQALTQGRIVLYTLGEEDALLIRQQRQESPERHGNPVQAGEAYPAMIVRTWPGDTAVNLQVFLDGDNAYWATSRTEGTKPGTWAWPERR